MQMSLTMPELAEALRQEHGFTATPAMLSRYLIHRLDFTYKDLCIIASLFVFRKASHALLSRCLFSGRRFGVFFGLCDCGGLWVKGHFVGGFEQVLTDRRHRHLGMGFGDPKIAGAMQAEEAFHRAKALLDPKPAFGDEPVAASFRGP